MRCKIIFILLDLAGRRVPCSRLILVYYRGASWTSCKLAKHEKKMFKAHLSKVENIWLPFKEQNLIKTITVSCFWAKLLHCFRNTGFPVFLSVQNKTKTLSYMATFAQETFGEGGCCWVENALFRLYPTWGDLWLDGRNICDHWVLLYGPQMLKTRSCWRNTTSPTSFPSTTQLHPSWRWNVCLCVFLQPARPLDPITRKSAVTYELNSFLVFLHPLSVPSTHSESMISCPRIKVLHYLFIFLTWYLHQSCNWQLFSQLTNLVVTFSN